MSIFRSGIIVGIFTLLSRITGFIRDIFISSMLGASILSDIFNIAFRLPNFFRRIFAEGAFNSAFIPIFNSKLNDDQDATNFLNQTFTILTITLLLFVIIMELLLPVLIYILAPGFDQDSIHWQMTIDLCKISMPYLLCISIVSLFCAILNSYNKFAAASATPVLLNIVIIVSLLSLKNYTETLTHALVWGIFLSGIVQLLFIYIFIKKNNLTPRFVKPKLDHDIKKLFRNMIPGIIGGGVMQINILVDQSIASFLEAGSISFLAYADRLNQLPLALIGTAIGTVLLPNLSKQIKIGDRAQILFTQNRALEIAIILAIPSAFALTVLSEEIIALLFERGKFTHSDTINTAKALAVFSVGLVPYVLVKVLLPSLFANFDTKTPLKISVICLISNVVFNLLFIKYFGYLAIAIATSISAWLNFYLIYRNLVKRDMVKLDARLKKNIIAILFSSILMIIMIKFLENQMLLAKIFLAMIVYLAALYINKVINIQEIKTLLRK